MKKKIFKYRRWSLLGGVTIIGVVILMWVSRGESQMFSPYSDFQAMSLEQLKTLQVKLTFVGEQDEVLSTVAFTSSFNTLDLSKFVPFRRPNINYGNDDSAVHTFAATPQELKAVIDNVAALPNVTAGGVATEPYLSFALLNTNPSTKAFEAVLNKADSSALFAKLRLALQGNKAGLRNLSEMACPLDLLEPERPVDVTASVSLAISGVRLNRATGRFVGTATVKNNSAQSIPGPISIIFILGSNVKLFNADGTTCGTSPKGMEFIDLPLTGNQFPPGGSIQVSLDFENPDQEAIKPTIKVLAGPGAR